MDCNNCICGLVCTHAQDAEYREQIRSGTLTCCDYYQRPDGTVEKAIKSISAMDIRTGIPQDIYVIEECSELIKELTKKQRGKGSEKDILAEACDVITTIFVLFAHYGVSKDFVKQQILYKCNRALARYNKSGEV